MKAKKNIFIEGLPGAGKSTLLTNIVKRNPEYKAYREGDLSTAGLSWCAYMTVTQFTQILEKYPDLKEEILRRTMQEGEHYVTAYTLILAENRSFYELMENYEIYNGKVDFNTFRKVIMERYQALTEVGNVFESSFFQYSLESMMLFYEMSDEEILMFYKEAYEILKGKSFKLIYLDVPNIRENLWKIRKERSDNKGNEMWYPLMLRYLTESPYGKSHGYKDTEDMIAYYERRRAMEHRIIAEILGQDAEVILISDSTFYSNAK